MTGSGRCHGPGCTQGARAGDFCRQECVQAWERQFHGVEDVAAEQVPCSCMCGGDTAWMVQRPSGAWEMAGCTCHNPNPASTVPTTSTTYPQVASHPWANPRLIGTVGREGWLERLFDRLFWWYR